MLRRNIAAPSLKILWNNLNSVNCYDKSNMNVFTLSQWENFGWGLIYFDQFICTLIIRFRATKFTTSVVSDKKVS